MQLRRCNSRMLAVKGVVFISVMALVLFKDNETEPERRLADMLQYCPKDSWHALVAVDMPLLLRFVNFLDTASKLTDDAATPHAWNKVDPAEASTRFYGPTVAPWSHSPKGSQKE